MSSQFIGLTVKLTLHSQPGSSLQAKILSIDQATNTLTVQKQDGSQAVLKRTDIASLAACKPAETAPKPTASTAPPRTETATPTKANIKTQKKQEAEHAAVPAKPSTGPAFVDPAIMSYNRSNDTQSSLTDSSHTNPLLATLMGSDPAVSRSSTPSRSPRPTPKSAKKKQAAPASRGGSPAISNASLVDEFDFSAGLKAFDKRKIWDDIRAADNTDPAQLLVSHNRITNGPVELVRGPNGVGPVNSVSTPDRGRMNAKDGQQKMKPNEMVLSPSPERSLSPAPVAAQPKATPATTSAPAPAPAPVAQNATGNANPNKPTYEQLEDKIRKLEAELALARRRNVLLEELAGLGLSGSTRADAGSSDFGSWPVKHPHSDSHQSLPDLSATEAAQEFSKLNLQPTTAAHASSAATDQATKSPAPSALSSALSAAGFSISNGERSSSSTPAPATPPAAPSSEPAEEKEEPLFGHIVSTPVLTLLFPTAALQHAALARMEAFYESSGNAKQYLSLQQAADERICRNYQGFNFPVRQGVQEWLDAMFECVNGAGDSPKWWAAHCSNEENQLLDLLVSLGVISPFEGASSRSPDAETGALTYIISCVASQAHSTLPHELLHALYFLSPTYRQFVSRQYASLSAPNKKVIETDLGLRKYAPTVFQDEFQAYLAEGLATEKEFGNKPAAECKLIAQQLREHAQKEWSLLGFDMVSGKHQEMWELVKWQTLDRYAAWQKSAKKKNAKGNDSPAKIKGAKKSKK